MEQKELGKAIEEYLAVNLDRYLEMLRQMVEINSFTANAVGVNQLGDLTAELFAPLGFTAERVQSAVPEYGKHLVLTRMGRTNKTIGLISHLDTVFPPEEEARNDFHWRPERGRIYGPGTVDIKGGTLVIFMILEALQRWAPEVFTAVTWTLLLDAAEEAEAEDFGRLCVARLPETETLAALIFEGGSKNGNEFQIVVARKGMAVFGIEVEGKASHAGSAHENGANAIVQLANTIQAVDALTDYEKQITVNVGTVDGGTVTNRVPHHASARAEMRAFAPEIFAQTVQEIKALADEVTVRSPATDFACEVTVNIERETLPWPRNERTDYLFSVWQRTGEELGFVILPEERGGLSDGNHFWAERPCIDGLGPSGGNAHCSERSADGSKDQEYCLVSSFVPKTVVNTMAIINLVQENME